MRYGWPFIAICSALSIVLFIGKTELLFFGMKEATKEQYNLKRYSRIFGFGFGLIAVMFAIVIYHDKPYELRWLLTPGISLVGLATIIASKIFARVK